MILLLMMVALFSVQLTCNTMMASVDLGVKLKNRTYYNNLRTSGGESMLQHSFVTPAEGLGITGRTVPLPDIPNEPSGSVFFEAPNCVSDADFAKIEKCVAWYEKPTTKSGEELCDYWIEIYQCILDGLCAHCPNERVNKMVDHTPEFFQKWNICERPVKLSCSHKTLWIILGVLGGLIVVAVVIGVLVCCCCIGAIGGGRNSNNRKSSKHSSKGGSKSKIRKASSKQRGSSRH